MRIENLALRWMAEQQYAQTTATTYSETVKLFARRFPLPVERVTEEHLIEFLTTDTNGRPTRRAPATIQRQRTTLRMLFRWAHRRGLVRSNPAADLLDLSVGRGQRRGGRWLTRDQASALIDAIDIDEPRQHRDRTLIVVALLTGLRRAELAAARWRDVDIEAGRLSVFGKGAKPATIGLPPEACEALADWRLCAHGELGRAQRANAPIFPTGRTGGGLRCERFYRIDWTRPLTPGGICRIIAQHAQDAGLGVLGTHDLRRTFAGWLDEDGVDLAGIQAALRHSGPSVTVRCYLDPSPRRAVEATKGLRISPK